MRPKILDLFCKAGGAGMGYHLAGFEVVGVDIEPQPHYPFEFHQAHALEFLAAHGHEFDAIHASPPCQAHTSLRHMQKREYVDLIPETREALRKLGKPYIIENVPGAPLEAWLMLCGTMFALRTPCGAELRRHRYFETNWFAGLVPDCNHGEPGNTVGAYGGRADSTCMRRARAKRMISVHGDKARDRRRTISITGSTPQRQEVHNVIRETFTVADARIAMGIEWMTMAELSQAIPPAYTQWIGERLLEELRRAA